MSFLTGPKIITEQDLYTSSATAQEAIGTRAEGTLGRQYRYVLVGASDLVAGNTLQESAVDTQFVNMAVGTAGAVGDQYIQVTNGTTTVVPTAFVGGTISIYTAGTSLIGEEYIIKTITGTLTSGGALKVWLDRPLRKAITTSATVTVRKNIWSGAIQSTGTTATGIPIGVAIYPLTAAQYGWVLTHGEADVLCDATTMIVGSDLALSITVAGAAGLYAVASGRVRIGMARQANASGKGITAFIQID